MQYVDDMFNCCAVGGLSHFPLDEELCTLKKCTYKESEACEDCASDYDAKGRQYWEPGNYCYRLARLEQEIRNELDGLASVYFAALTQEQSKAGKLLRKAGFTVYRKFPNPNSANIVTIYHYWKGRTKAPSMA